MSNRRFPKSAMIDVSRDVAARLLRLHSDSGGGDTLDPLTWLPVAQGLGCRIVSFFQPGGAAGAYMPSGEYQGVGVIAYNSSRNPRRQALIIIHELVHHVLYPHHQGCLFETNVMESYDGESGNIEHLTARMVEQQIKGRRRIRD